ncbi:MAG: histidine--tRNA ligase, partial [Clostridiales bacterium]|nr:histidine--tRNA ligase [Clostridiales bacterium]
RQFRQFGVEVLGSEGPESDVEVISLCYQLFNNLGIDNITLEINSIGCRECRAEYHAELKHFFEDRKSELCPTCIDRMDKNPLRILDCKNKNCKAIAKDAPIMLDHLCDECSEHFDGVKSNLESAGIPYIIDPKIVRGLDYYTRTVFEFTTDQIGAQGTVCGGGRYNGLVGELGGQDIPGLGFAIGLNRLIMLMEASESEFCKARKCELYIAPIGDAAKLKSTSIIRELRDEGFYAETDLMNRSLRAQMKYADKLGALFTIVIGDNELEKQEFEIKNMQTGEKTSCTFDMLMSTMYALTTDLNIDEVIEAAEFL